MNHFGSQMRSFAGSGEHPQRPQLQPQSQPANGVAKPAAGPPPKPHQNGCADVKPRLTKEQHDILEAHFQQQHKPSTSTKKTFAENLGVPVDKINNWFQNRRAKVKQDLKKQMNQYNMSIGVYGQPQMPMVASQYPPVEQLQPQPPMARDLYPINADISPTGHPIQSIEGPSAPELGSQISHHQSYSLRSIPETHRTMYHNPNAVMQSFMAATAGASYMQPQPSSLPPQNSGFPYDTTGLPNSSPQGFPGDLAFPVPSTLPNDHLPTNEAFNGFSDFSGFDYSSLTANPAIPADVHNSAGSNASDSSPFSGAQASPFSGAPSSATTQSPDPNAPSVTSIASVYSGWMDERNAQPDIPPTNEGDDFFEQPYGMSQASVSDHALAFWGPNGGQSYSQSDMYQHSNASAHAVLSPGQPDEKHLGFGSDLDVQPSFGEDVYSRRNSSATNLATNIEAIHIQGTHTSEDSKQPNHQSSIAERRQKRPTALNPSTLRSASYTGSMSSPGGSSEHTLRRIRSSGIPNAAGRIQKPTPGSAQRSPMTLTFAEAAASPKFARTFSSSSATTAGGSLAPPTPLTPNEMARFPYWQSNTVIRNNAPMPEHSSPDSLSANWSAEPQSAGVYSSIGSPPSTPLDLRQLNQARLSENLFRDSPPQSAPATQQSFPRTAFVSPPQMKTGFHSTTDLTLAQPKPSHFRRPSLPDGGQGQMNDPHVQYSSHLGDMYDDMSFHSLPTHNVPFAPPACMPEFLVHEYAPSQGGGPGSLLRPTTEPQPKSYIFTNQGPSDFRS